MDTLNSAVDATVQTPPGDASGVLPAPSVLDAPVKVARDGTVLSAINFSATAWRQLAFVGEVTRHLKGCRVVGVVSCRPAGDALTCGVLLRHISSRTYRLAGPFPLLQLETEPTESFLVHHRQGHHGGPGRCQGTLTQDGYSYTRSMGITLSDADIAWLIRFGGGNLSMGIRRAATAASKSLLQDDAKPVHALEDPSQPVHGVRKSRVRAYMDADSQRRLEAIGRGNTSAGVRIAVGFLSRKPAA